MNKVRSLQSLEDTMFDADYWLSLCPELHITEDCPLDTKTVKSVESLAQKKWQGVKSSVRDEGYFHYPQFFDPKVSDRLARAVTKLQALGIPPTFSFVFDEFWALGMALRPILGNLLGSDYLTMPNVFTWLVTHENNTGFDIHRDEPENPAIVSAMQDSQGNPNYLTVWVPLTDVDHRNASIGILPASRDPDYGKTGLSDMLVPSPRDVLSLQCEKGSVLGWTIQLLHWATRPLKDADPRISVGFYFQNRHAPLIAENHLDLTRPLPLIWRLRLIGEQFQLYERNPTQELSRLIAMLVNLGGNYAAALPRNVA